MKANETIGDDVLSKVDALGIWDGKCARVIKHRGPVFHRLHQGRRGTALVLTIEETVYALMRTNFVLLDERIQALVSEKNILKEILATRDWPRLLRIHVYLAVIARGKTPEVIGGTSCDPECITNEMAKLVVSGDKNGKEVADAAGWHMPCDNPAAEAMRSDSTTGTACLLCRGDDDLLTRNGAQWSFVPPHFWQQELPWEDAYPRSSHQAKVAAAAEMYIVALLNRRPHNVQPNAANAMPYEVVQKFREICGTIYPVEPLTITKALFEVEGVPLYATTADSACMSLLASGAIATKKSLQAPEGERVGPACDEEQVTERTVKTDQSVDHTRDSGGSFGKGTGAGRASQPKGQVVGGDSDDGMAIIAVSNFFSVYFLNINCNITY
ncbi:alpha/beta hydrolase [Babesia caballi]|uniref:Alpha/beta hydrolase n=1 Tax=Babesia caballi TaxID=5871 RepID=A0AAV4LM22_BABCB|nr:alpha/beta hydrolase [Babesia caballi]